MDVRVQDLRYFIAVAEELSFTRAANDRLFISQPALSKQIRQLEACLRVTLFDRDRRAVALTAAGKALLPRAQQIVQLWERARRETAEASSTQLATLTVGFQTRIGRGLIPGVTARMSESLPSWRLRFRQVPWSDPSIGLAAGDVDVAIAWLPIPDDTGLSWRVVASEQRWVAVPPGHRLASREVIPFAELIDEPFIALPSSAGPLREFWLATASRPRPADVAAEAETVEESYEAVASGLGVALLAAGNVEIYQRNDVVCRPVTGLSPGELAVVWRSPDRRDAVRVFVNACIGCFCGDSSRREQGGTEPLAESADR
ncbi:LysR family transcriptional regulator [Amycolatopsis sp. WAC 04197]|uniref:LysR family transcriptional regulator n=1 Tax=Amycolatopsis TaxID=1813 RepID=UPI000F76E91C|nr:LysR family transcriptional regulator [Amycolatopsis sp. WAC 04197]RSN43438.1 LysR family transcriptional regulator [Amycolatopsis sp. WAC 04197]